MTQQNKSKPVQQGKRGLLAGTAISGVAAMAGWMKPAVNSVALPSHATTTSPPVITSASALDEGCANVYQGIYEVNYSFTSVYGVVSHVITASCDASDSLEIADGLASLGVNLLDQNVQDDSLNIEGTEFAGSVFINDVRVTDDTNSSPQNCTLVITLTDENGGQAVETLDLSSNCDD